MAENAGAIKYEFAADISSVLKAEGQMTKANSNMVKSFDATDKAVKRFAKTQLDAGNSINKAGQVLDANGQILTKQTQQYRTLAVAAAESLSKLKSSSEESFVAASSTADLLKKNINSLASDAISKLDKSFDVLASKSSSLTPKVNGITKGIRSAGAAASKSSFQASNFSYQIQDIAVQAQMGISPLVIFAQQFPQMAVGMGAAAAGIGAVVAILGALGTALLKSKSAQEQLEKAIEKTKAVMTLGTDGVAEYAKEMKELNKVSEQLAKIKLAEAILNQNQIIKSSSKLIVESAENTSKLYKSTFENLRGLTESVAKDIGGNMADVAEAIKSGQNIGDAGSYLNRDLDNIASKFKITRSEALELGLAMSDVAQGGGAVAIKSLQNVTEDLAASYGYSNEKLTKLSAGMVEYFIAAKNSTDGINELRQALFGKTNAIDEDVEGNKKAKASYEQLTAQMEQQAIELEKGSRAAFAFGLEQTKLTDTQKQSLLTQYDNIEALKKTKEETDEATAANERYEKSVRDRTASDLDWFNQQVAQQDKKDAQATATLTTQVQSIGLTPEQEIQAQYESELELLRQAEEKKLEIEGTYGERREQLEKERLERLKSLQENNTDFMEAAFGNLDTQIAGTMAGVVLGAQDGEDALKSLATTILTQVVGAIIQQGIASVFASQTAAKGQTAANAEILSTAAPAAASVSLATAGANSIPAVAGIAAVTAAMAGIGSVMGGRQYGGPVSSGMYRVNETGVPEVYSQGGKDYLMNTKNANITPLDKASGGGSGMTVNVSNNTPYEVYVTQDQATQIATVQIGKEASKAAKGQGTMYKGVKKGAALKTNARN